MYGKFIQDNAYQIFSESTGFCRRYDKTFWCVFIGSQCSSVVLLAPSAYLASATSTAECTSRLLPARLRDIKDSGIDAALSAWLKQATSPATPSVMPVPPTSSSQCAWDDICCKVQADSLLDAAMTQLAVLVFSVLVLRAPATG